MKKYFELITNLEKGLEIELTLGEKIRLKHHYLKSLSRKKDPNLFNSFEPSSEAKVRYFKDYGLDILNELPFYWHRNFPEYFRKLREDHLLL